MTIAGLKMLVAARRNSGRKKIPFFTNVCAAGYVIQKGTVIKKIQIDDLAEVQQGQYSGSGKPELHAGTSDLLTLIDLCKAGNRKAQKELYDRFAPVLYPRIRRYTADLNRAQEILNDSFYKILTHINAYTASGSFEGWIHRITINTITDHLRKNIRYDRIAVADPETQDLPVPETAVGRLSYKELLEVIHALPEVHRAVFNLFVFDGFAHKEIAAQLNITENNSRWHLNDARRRLKEKLDDHMP
jgi:RNA polymerase sigma factor (sigma-70 family)